MNPEITAAVIGAVVGAFLGAVGAYVIDLRKAERSRQEHEEEREREAAQRRATIATAILQDCRRLEFELREIYNRPDPTRMILVRHALFYDALRHEVRWLSPKAVQPIAEFFRRVDHIYSATNKLRELGQGKISSTPQREYELRSHAGFALQVLPLAVAALYKEGGIIPGPLGWSSITYPELPKIPAPTFDDSAERLFEQANESSVAGNV